MKSKKSTGRPRTTEEDVERMRQSCIRSPKKSIARIASVVKRVEFVSDRVSYIVMRGRWCNIIVVNVRAPSEEKSDETKDSFYEELEQVFDHFPK